MSSVEKTQCRRVAAARQAQSPPVSGVAILIPDTMGRACAGLCASCQRMYVFQSERLNFRIRAYAKGSWDRQTAPPDELFREDTQRGILITGGDALMSQNKTLHQHPSRSGLP